MAGLAEEVRQLAHDLYATYRFNTFIDRDPRGVADLTVPGWNGAGYIILDTESGAGAYKISGGSNGGYAAFVLSKVSMMMGLLDGAYPEFKNPVVSTTLKFAAGGLSMVLDFTKILESCGGFAASMAIAGMILALGTWIAGKAWPYALSLFGPMGWAAALITNLLIDYVTSKIQEMVMSAAIYICRNR